MLSAFAPAAQPTIAPGTHIEALVVGAVTYRNVQIRSVNARTVMITHAGGMSSLKLRDLSPEWQARLGYDPAAAAAAEQAAAVSVPPPTPVAHTTAPIAAAHRGSGLDRLLRQQGQPAPMSPELDLRPKFFQLELTVKNQGRRPSCAIFAIVSALEFQHAELTGTPQKFSEEYLSWATRKTVQRILPPAPGDPGTDAVATPAEDFDDGFTLPEVVAALRGYGIPLQSSMPNRFGRAIAAIEDPPPAVIEEARSHQRVFVHTIPGRDNPTRINNLILALNAGIPVPVGLAWPHYRTIRSGNLNAQQPLPESGHAVTLVGYRCPSGRIEEVVFIFKNSWGANWGQGGYGTVTYHYLEKHLHGAVLLEVQTGGAATPG